MKKICFILTLGVLCFTEATATVKVVTTLPDLAAIAEYIGGDQVKVTAIATGYQNPHFVDPKPSYIVKLSKADLFVTVGLDLEIGWSPTLLRSSRNPKIQKGSPGYVDASEGIPLLQVPNSISREQGDIHIYGNPHYWLDPQRGKLIARNIYHGLTRVDPQHQLQYGNHLRDFVAQIDKRDQSWKSLMERFKGTPVIAYHNEWVYFEKHFGLRVVDFLEPKPGIPPTPQQLLKVIKEVKVNHINSIITSPYFPTKSADVVARQTDAKVVVLATSVGATEEIKNYFDLFDYNIKIITNALNN